MRYDPIQPDPTGFPMIWVPEIRLFVHCLPVTKVQFEYFLCAATDGHFDARWYEEILRLNPRATARRIWRGNYWNAFLSGILPAEAQRFAAWCGEGYRLLQAREWQDLYRALGAWSSPALSETGALYELGPRQHDLITQVEHAVEDACAQAGDPCGLIEKTLLRLGLIEWVATPESDAGPWGGLGEPHPSFCGNLFVPAEGDLIRPSEPESRRMASFGFRLAFDPSLVREDH